MCNCSRNAGDPRVLTFLCIYVQGRWQRVILMHTLSSGWSGGKTTFEGKDIENFISSIRFEAISEPINFEPNKNHSCIDLIITDQPNRILDCGTRASLDSFCHHQIIYCRVNFRIPPTVKNQLNLPKYLT